MAVKVNVPITSGATDVSVIDPCTDTLVVVPEWYSHPMSLGKVTNVNVPVTPA